MGASNYSNMGICCSDVSEAPDVILEDPIVGNGYEVDIEYIGRGDTYELWTKHKDHPERMKWLNIRRYKMEHDKVKYILENYQREEGKDTGQVLAYAIADPFDPSDYKYDKPEMESDSSCDNMSDSPDDAGEMRIDKAKWKTKGKVQVCTPEGEALGEISIKAKGKIYRTAEVVEFTRCNGEGQEDTKHCRYKIDYDTHLKKMKYKIEIPAQEDVEFKIKKDKASKCLSWDTAAFSASSRSNNKTECKTNAGFNTNVSFLMSFICSQVLCPNDVKEGCEPSKYGDNVFKELDHGVGGTWDA